MFEQITVVAELQASGRTTCMVDWIATDVSLHHWAPTRKKAWESWCSILQTMRILLLKPCLSKCQRKQQSRNWCSTTQHREEFGGDVNSEKSEEQWTNEALRAAPEEDANSGMVGERQESATLGRSRTLQCHNKCLLITIANCKTEMWPLIPCVGSLSRQQRCSATRGGQIFHAALNQGRFIWCHYSILSCLTSLVC